ncbi:MAG: hypothetical protein A3G41_02045 [Elusimicrobia bacterium RIFCSPLOWO2_12_FULL_59_9]|nr:MAG: hypothetical protein A3G41_02045 [Elusimicrobia bacterium RIFCSPLOWO2_12_FULL_59_9]
MNLLIFASGVLGAGLSLAGAFLAHMRLLAPMRGFILMLLGGLFGLVSVLAALIAILWSAFSKRPISPALLRALPGLGVALVFAVLFVRARKYPPINDITTTPGAPPRFDRLAALAENARRDMSYPPAFAEIQKKAYPDLAPLESAWSPAETFEKARAAARSMPSWSVISEDAASGRLEAVAETFLFRFKDDLALEVRAATSGSSLHMRSKSRDGRGDGGANAKRIRDFLDKAGGN